MHKFGHLHCNVDAQRGCAPHKPVLLLSLIQCFQYCVYNTNYITLTPELVQAFRFNWKQLVTTKHACHFTYPFIYLASEGFWFLQPKPGFEKSIRNSAWMTSSIRHIEAALEFVVIDDELSLLLQDKSSRKELSFAILNKYFPNTKNQFLPSADFLQNGIEQLSSPTTAGLQNADNEDEIYVRGGIFKKLIPQIYNNTCAISRSRSNSVISNLSMIDACHIVPFSESHDDSVGNGIALCPNLHRAFDRGLISISDDYTVLVSKRLVEDSSSPFNLSQFNGKPILLPYTEQLYPSLENLATHRRRFGF